MLVAEAIQFPVIHDLVKLRQLVPRERRVAHVEADLGDPSGWVRAARYPSEPREATEADARAAIGTARALVDAAREDIG